MMHAWSPHTFEAIDMAFKKAEGEQAFHAWGGEFEPTGRSEAQDAAEALAAVLTPDERQNVRDLVAELEAEDAWDHDRSLAQQNDLAAPAASTGHTAVVTPAASARPAPVPGPASSRKLPRRAPKASTGEPRPPGMPNSSSDPTPTASKPPYAWARADVPRDIAQTAPQVWHDNAKILLDAREATGLDQHQTAAFLDLKPATLHRFEQGAGKLPGTPASLGNLQLLALSCAQSGHTTPACIPDVITQPATSLPTTA